MKNAITDSTQPVRVVIYARYSDSKQTENSIEGQIKTCKAYIESMGYLDQPVNYRFQSGKQPFICLPMTHKETAFPLRHILSALRYPVLIFIVYIPIQTISIVCG